MNIIQIAERFPKKRTLWLEGGYVLSEEGVVVCEKINHTISELYESLLDDGYLPHELREALFSAVFSETTIINAMRS